MVVTLLLSISLLVVQYAEGIDQHEITIFAITNLDDNFGKSAVGAQWLAIEEINNNSQLLPQYNFNLKILNNHNNRQQALIYSLNATQQYLLNNNINATYFPIVLGESWSSLSASISPILGTFNMGQISGCSTSIALSDTNKYPYFYRTIPSDSLQAQGIILLCNTFNWTSIIIVYVNDEYGLYLSLEIQKLATLNNIDAKSIAIAEYEDLTYNYAAKQIKALNSFIIVIIIHENNFLNLFPQFEKENITGYPYLYIGTDGWLDSDFIKQYNLSFITNGFIGTMPWQTNSLPLNAYSDNVQYIINESMVKYNNLLNKWSYYFNNGYEKNLYLETPGTFVITGYDAIYCIFYAIQELENNIDKYGGNIMDLIHNKNSDIIINILNEIIVNTTDFIGASGRVMFDAFGNRINGFYSFGNILNDGNIDYFGYFYNDLNGEIQYKIDINKIIWPIYFIEKGMIPRSDILIHEQITTIKTLTFYVMWILLSVSILIALIFVILLICYQKNKIIRAASWRLNIVMLFGAILSFIAAMLYGIDERIEMSTHKLDLLCNIRLWILIISFTILFMPLFAKTYRLSKMFRNILTNTVFNDKQLIILILFCICIDIILLIIFIFFIPLKRIYYNDNLEIIDKLQEIQYKYGICSCTNNNTIYGIIIFWKLCELSFGIYGALNVSRIQDITNTLMKFDETGIQLSSILFTVIIICISGTMLLFANIYSNLYYLIISITILIISNIVLYLNLLPRIFAVITKNEEKYEKSPTQRMEAMIKQKLSLFSNGKSIPLL